MDFTDNEKNGVSVPVGEAVTTPAETAAEPAEEEIPVTKVEKPKRIAPEPYVRAVLPNRSSRDRARKYIITSVVFACIILLLVAGFAYYYATTDSRITDLEERIDILSSEKKILEDESGSRYTSYEEEIHALEMEIATLTDDIILLEGEIEILSKKADFLDDHIKIVDSKQVYHEYGCEYLDTSRFRAYNSKQVEDNSSYSRCPYCN